MKKKILFIIITFFCTSVFTSAQDEFDGGSPYSIFGIGDLNYNTSIRTFSMGIQGIALAGNYVNALNPAANYKLPNTTLSLSGKYYFMKYSDGINTAENSDGNVDGMNIGIPISNEDGITMILGFNRLSSIGYKITHTEVNQGISEKRVYAGKGGISRINAGLTYGLLNFINIGAEYNYGFGNLVDERRIDFQTQGVVNTDIRREIDLQQSYFKAGVVLDFGKFSHVKQIRNLSLGFYYQNKVRFNSSGEVIYTTSLGRDTVKLSDGKLDFPASFGLGIANRFGDRYILSADMVIHNWEGYTSDKISIAEYKNSYRAGLGLEVIPPDRIGKTFWEEMTYRLGVFYGEEYYSLNNENVNYFGASAGVNIPLTNLNSMDFGLRYFNRGKDSNGLLKDQQLSLYLGFNFGEIWFIRRSDD